MAEKTSKHKTTWDLTPLFDSDNDPKIQEEREKLVKESQKFINKWKNDESYLKDPKKLKEALDDFNDWSQNSGVSGNQGYYYSLRQSTDMTNKELKAQSNKLNDIAIKIINETQFFTHRIAKIPQEKQKKFLDHPDLSYYKHFLHRLFEDAKYLLSEEEEKILNLMFKVSHSNWVRMTSELISKEEREIKNEDGNIKKMSVSEIGNLLLSGKRDIRKNAFETLAEILHRHSDTAEFELNSILERKKIGDELRGFERPDLARHISDDIDSEVVDTLIQAVSDNYSVSQKYYALRAKIMGLEKLEYYDRVAEFGKIEKKYTFDEAVDLVMDTFNALDKEFSEIFKKYLGNGQIDVFPKKGKRGGAFCAGYSVNTPTYILLNHSDNLLNVTTLAHELGHGINNELIKKKHKEIYFGTPLATAEVASTFMEDFVLQKILKEANDELKLTLMINKLDGDIGAIQRQISAYRFEQDLHREFREKGFLPKEVISEMFIKHMKSYLGEAVNMTKGSEISWVSWGHFRSFFYVYSYASGLLISKSLQNSVKKNPEFIHKVKEFLSVGTSKSPKDAFAEIGIDITNKDFWTNGIQETKDLIKKTHDLAQKLGKI